MPNIEVFDVEETFLNAQPPIVEEKVTRRGQTDSWAYMHAQKYRSEKTGEYEKKFQISAREYMKLLENADKNKKVLKKRRQCFLYNKSYMVIDTYLNVESCPSIIKVLNEKGSKKMSIPSSLELVRAITDEKIYDNFMMADPNWVMPKEDKEKIEYLGS